MSTACAESVPDDGTRYIRRVAGALATSRNAFPEDICYEIDGNVLTWIVRGYEGEFKIECRNASEVIDGFYRAEYFLDTSKILDPYSELHSGIRCVEPEPEPEPEPRVIVSQQSIVETIRLMQLKAKLRQELEEYEASQAALEGEFAAEHPDDSGGAVEQASKAPRVEMPKQAAPPHGKATQPISTPSKCIRIMNHTRDVCKETMKQVLQTRNGGCMPPTIVGMNAPLECDIKSQDTYDVFQSDVIKREVRPIKTENMREKRRKQEMVDERATVFKGTEQDNGQEELSSEDTDDIASVRRGKRARKNSIFQDCYTPIANNEWTAEGFIKAQKMAY